MAATFLEACGLPERWQQRERFTVLDTGFGDGRNFITAWQNPPRLAGAAGDRANEIGRASCRERVYSSV